MDENNLPETKTGPDFKFKLMKVTAAVILALASLIFAIDRFFTSFEPSSPNDIPVVDETPAEYMEGTIKYVNPAIYPGENVSYELVDDAGNTLILLRAEDAKLEVAENMKVRVKGLKTKTADGADVLIVSEVTISN